MMDSNLIIHNRVIVAIALKPDVPSFFLSPSYFFSLQLVINVMTITRHSTVTVYFTLLSIISYHRRWSILDITSSVRAGNEYTSVYEQNSFAYKTLITREAICASLSFFLCAIEIILNITIYRHPSVFITAR